jgi:hypothetical protein
MTETPEPRHIARLDHVTQQWVAQEWSAEANRFVDVVPQREATDDEIDARDGVVHPDWATIQPSGTSEHHWVTFDSDGLFSEDDDRNVPANLLRVIFHCDAPDGANCRWTCPEDCEAFPCVHPPEPSDCWADPWFDGNAADTIFDEHDLDSHGAVQQAVVDVNWEGDYATLSYRITDRALDADQKVVTR